jgi:hypothetical protein
MAKTTPDHHDAELLIQVYDLSAIPFHFMAPSGWVCRPLSLET